MFTVRKLTATLLLSIGIVTPIMLLAFLVWMHSDYNTYLWVINGPYPFSHMGSGPFVLWMFFIVMAASGVLAILSRALHNRSRRNDDNAPNQRREKGMSEYEITRTQR
jgi:hypothetical protein